MQKIEKKDKILAQQNTIKSHKYNKKVFDKTTKGYKFNSGDLVYVKNGNRINRKKLDELRIGPFERIKIKSDSIYKIKTGRRNEDKGLFHKTKLIPVEDRTDNGNS